VTLPVREDTLLRKLRALPKRGFGRVVETVALLWAMLADPEVPTWAKTLVVAALLYLLHPWDLAPDILPGGLTDDAALLVGTLARCSSFATKQTRDRAREIRRDLGL